jgi:acetyl-CoA acyltransferase
MSLNAWIVDGIRTPFGRYGGGLSAIRTDDLGAIPLRHLMEQHPNINWNELDDVIYGCANQAGEDNRNVARMSALLAGLPIAVPGCTVNRLCGSGLDAVAIAARAIHANEAQLIIAGGVESMTRAPFVMPKADSGFSRQAKIEDSTIGWRFVNPRMQHEFGIASMPETAENVAQQFGIAREDQDQFALRSQQRCQAALSSGFFDGEIVPVPIPQKKGEALWMRNDEHPRGDTSIEQLRKLKGIVKPDGSVTAGNASGVNDGACALLLASQAALDKYKLTPRARIVGSAVVGLEPRIMGMGPAPATQKLLSRIGWQIAEVDVIELNEAFASQGLAVLRQLGLPDDAAQVNPNGGAIALGHPLGASGARLVLTALRQLERIGEKRGGRRGLITMCIGVGQGIALAIERA